MREEEVFSVGDLIDIIVDWILEESEIHDLGELVPLDLGEEGDLPVFERELEAIATSQEVREAVAERMSAAQAEGHAFPLPTARQLGAARERALARRQRR